MSIKGHSAAHLQGWLEQFVDERDRGKVLDEILAFEAEYPDIHITDNRSWPELRVLAHRFAERKAI